MHTAGTFKDYNEMFYHKFLWVRSEHGGSADVPC